MNVSVKPHLHAAIALLLTACAAAPAAQPVSGAHEAAQRDRVALAKSSAGPAKALNSALVLVSAAPCARSDASDLGEVVRRDVPALSGALSRTFPDHAAAERVVSDGASFASALASLPRDRGFLLIFIGHGFVQRDAGTQYRSSSYVCIDGEPVAVAKLIETITAPAASSAGANGARFPWATLVLVACESAFVDVSQSPIPLSVMTASPREIAFDFTSESVGLTPMSESLARAIADPASDSSGDGIVSDQELFEAVLGYLHEARSTSDASPDTFPEPGLRRESGAHVPLFATADASPVLPAALDAIGGDSELGQAIAAQIAAPSNLTLPEVAHDYFVLDDPARHQACVTRPGADGLCAALRAGGAEPVPLASEPAPGFVREDMQPLARFITFAEIYAITSEGDWLQSRRLRDDVLVGVSLNSRVVGLVRPREQVIGGTARDPMTRVEGRTHGRALGAATLCPQATGQCFVSSE